jgi:cytochrome c oxidase subunit II
MLFFIMLAICLLVFFLLAYVVLKFNAKRNPTPSRTAHNTVLEVAWTVLPVLILVVIAIPSFRLLYFLDEVRDADVTLKAIGPMVLGIPVSGSGRLFIFELSGRGRGH